MQQYQRTTFRNLMGQVTYKQTRHSAVTLPSSNNHKLRNTRQWHIIEAIPSVPRPQPKTLSNASKNLDLLPTRSKAAKTLQLGFLDNQLKNQNFGCKTRLLNKLRKQHYESSSPNHDLRVKESKADKNIMEHVPGKVLDSATG
uniref:Uncharacterized protein n=1 Tax=Physcomitrium patens TaxID=3218 RepID=A0A2K1IVL1_PHYPA|nr:hypothetical protein PHYPA_025249 [Physcomitrium patens]